ncbi:baseplate wedge subunit and tail pin [Proteus phage PM2]|uniref:Baseplate wedge subunit and tail pin n=1 Tax=Proteus phage PM2 TaxID=2025809 RepID=A0A249XWP3_9CAUD|nr:baseplate wedge subunit and tail pin [Proteus phage PM2]ASZ76400.1 baseplate wedge subunit and tail pin [Proteus phage PM2]
MTELATIYVKVAKKTNENFKEIYHELGDDKILHSAGAWKTYTAKSGALTPQFGQSLALNTLEGPYKCNIA